MVKFEQALINAANGSSKLKKFEDLNDSMNLNLRNCTFTTKYIDDLKESFYSQGIYTYKMNPTDKIDPIRLWPLLLVIFLRSEITKLTLSIEHILDHSGMHHMRVEELRKYFLLIIHIIWVGD